MILLKSAVAAIAATSFAGHAQAQDSGAYVGLGASAYVTEPIGVTGTDLFAVDAKARYNFNKYFGVEAPGALSVNSDSEPFVDGSLSRKIDYSLAAFTLARSSVSEKFDVFARRGVHNTHFGIGVENPPLIDDVPFTTETGFAVGAVTQDKKNAMRADYTDLDDTMEQILCLLLGD